MSLATRCTSCGTIFKVVQDQLKVSEGWVRCGRCNEVFNALDGLFDLERDPPPQRPANAPRPAAGPESPPVEPGSEPTQPMGLDQTTQRPAPPPPAPSARPPETMPEPDDDLPATHEDDALDSRWLLRPSSDGRSASQRRSRKARGSDFADARFPKDVEFDLDDSDFLLGADADAAPTPAAPRPMPEVKGQGDKARKRRDGGKKKPSGKAKPAAAPSFVRRADRRAQWRHPAVRATLAGVALALSALLVGQTAYAFRDELAARHPEWRPVVEQICALTGCEIAPWRHIEDLAVDSVTLVRGAADAAAAEPPAYKLSVVLHNRSSVAIAVPHVELSLTDSSGELVSKRVLAPAEFGFTAPDLAPDSNTTLQARLVSAGNRIAGYTVELFYP
ncbi:zinc-ribbon and DUF3426 domain-containing protein [Aquabacterium sp.]|uniref:zinc-ribbon and DUF3426 domain-containing protein n=1 Tax=Aquabacterium sp. TaxID=1872578 RepID=UPI0035B14352